MKKTYQYLLALIAVMGLASTPAMGQIRFGVKGGLGLNKVSFNRDVLDNKNYLGYSIGITSELNVPILGLGFDVSVLYTHRSSELINMENGATYKRNYIEIPVHAKYKLHLLGLENVAIPFIYAGPDFSFLTHSSDPSDSFKDSKMLLSLDVGGGVEIVRKVQLSVHYSYGVNKAFEYVGVNDKAGDVTGKDQCWTISAAYFF